MEEISDEMFVKEMRILWQNISVEKRNQFANIINDYFVAGEKEVGDRADKIINKMQVMVEW